MLELEDYRTPNVKNTHSLAKKKGYFWPGPNVTDKLYSALFPKRT